MRAIFILIPALVAAILYTLPAKSDQNPSPTNVGLYNYSTYTVSTTTAIPILPRNNARALLYVQNQGAVSVVVKPGSAPANATDGIVLTAGQSFMPIPAMVDALYGISASSTAKIVMIEEEK